MKRVWRGYQQHKDLVLVLLGLLAVSLITLPYLVLGEGSYVQVHDQLDGEVLNYMYQARYLGQGNVIPQFMNGMDKASMLPPAPLGVLLYKLLPPFAAYGVMHWLCLLTGFLGMYGLCRRLGVRGEVCFAAACLFCYIPFYPTYGLAALGQPMLVLCALNLRDGRAGKKAFATGRYYLAIALYGACSSLTLIGYVWVAAGLFWTLCLAVGEYRKRALFSQISEGEAGKRQSCSCFPGGAGKRQSCFCPPGGAGERQSCFCPPGGAGKKQSCSRRLGGASEKGGLTPALRVGGGTLVLLGVYLVTNRDLLRALSGNGFTTHRQEMVLQAAEHPLAAFRELIFSGGSYSPVYSAGILTAAVLLALAALICALHARRKNTLIEENGLEWRKNQRQSMVFSSGKAQGPEGEAAGEKCNGKTQVSHACTKDIRAAWALIGLILCGALLAVLWNSSPIVSLRLSIGGIVTYFQADRIYWCFPFLWMLALSLLLEGICKLGESLNAERAFRRRIIPVLCCLLLLAVEGLQILRDSPLNKNIRLMLLKDYEQVTWESIYMDEVFARIDRAIGADKEHYSVVSLGIYPSIALYHGYTCADGYSNNYDLAYKHRFRRIMAKELEKSDEALRYFDDWGNRLYLTGAPYGINGMVPKGQPAYIGLDYDLEAMQSLNIRYLFSAAPVELSTASLEQTSLRLELLEGSPFTDDTAYYEVWIYQITSAPGVRE